MVSRRQWEQAVIVIRPQCVRRNRNRRLPKSQTVLRITTERDENMDAKTSEYVAEVTRRNQPLSRGAACSKKTADFYTELKRRNVLNAGATYIVMAWLAVQVADVLCGAFGFPDWVMKGVLIALALGFPVTMILSWYIEITTRVEWDTNLSSLNAMSQQKGRKMDLVVIAALILVVGILLARQPEMTCFSEHLPVQTESGAATTEMRLR